MINTEQLTNTTVPEIMAMEPEDELLRRMVMPGPWFHNVVNNEDASGRPTLMCDKCGSDSDGTINGLFVCTVPPALDRPLEVIAFELRDEARKGKGRAFFDACDKVIDTKETNARDWATAYYIAVFFEAIDFIKAALIAKKGME